MRRFAALALTMAVGAVGITAFAGPAGAGVPPITVDAQLKLKGQTGFVGDGIIDTRVGQSLSTAASPAQKAVFTVRGENEKFKKNRIGFYVDDVSCEEGDVAVSFFWGGENVTDDVFNDNFVVGGVPAREHVDLRMKLKVTPGGICEVVVGVYSAKFMSLQDFVFAGVVSTQPGGPF